MMDDARRALVGIVLAAVLLAGWLSWFLGARVAVSEIAEFARVEVERIAHRVDAPVTGRVETVHLVLGKTVEAGELLVGLESKSLELELRERRDRVRALAEEIEHLKRQRAAAEEAILAHASATRARIAEAEAQKIEAAERAKLANVEAGRSGRLFQGGFTSAADRERAATEEKVRRAAAAASELNVNRITAEGRAEESDLAGEIARLRRDLAQLEGSKQTEEVASARLEHEIERRKIRAPVAGRVGDITVLQPCSVLKEGQQVAVIVPSGGFRLVATFQALTAVGRIRPGQRGRLRLAGFPWAQYGTLPVIVAGVASEPRAGLLRVELDFERDPRSMVSLEHGLEGTVEVEVERVSPAILALRFVGRLLGAEVPPG